LDFNSDSSMKQQSAVDLSLHLDALSRFRLLLNAVCLLEKQNIIYIPILLIVFGLTRHRF